MCCLRLTALVVCRVGRVHAAGGGSAAGPRPRGGRVAGERLAVAGPPAGAAHRRQEGRRQGRHAPAADRHRLRRAHQRQGARSPGQTSACRPPSAFKTYEINDIFKTTS